MSDPVKIAYISTTCEIGGAEKSLTNLVKAIRSHGFDPVVALPGPGPLASRLAAIGVRTVFLPMETRRRRRPLAFRRSQAAITRWLQEEQPALFHVNSFWAPELAIPAGVRAGLKVIYHCRDFYESIDKSRTAAFRQCSRVIAITKCVAQNLESLLPGLPVVVAYNSIDLDTLEASEPDREFRKRLGWQDAFIVGIASRISPDKGHLEFLRAAAEVASKHPQARFVVVGGSQFTHYAGYPDEVRQECTRLGLDDKVHFTGFVDNVHSLYKVMDACVCASSREPFGLVVVEAMACGTPVVATRSGGPEEIIEDGATGLLVDVGNPSQMASAIERLMQERDLRTGIIGRAAPMVRVRFSLEEAKHVAYLYRDLLNLAQGDWAPS